jgi:signal transduction histidine kinase
VGFAGALAMVTDLLDLSLAESGGLSVDRKPVDLAVVAAEAVEDHRGAAEAAGHVLVWEGGAQMPIHTDPVRVREVLGNLLSNAIKYTPAPGRITLWIERAAGGAAPGPGEWIATHVRDSGPGIPPDARESIFGEFHRAAFRGAGERTRPGPRHQPPDCQPSGW